MALSSEPVMPPSQSHPDLNISSSSLVVYSHRFVDLTLPLTMKKADWVMSFEVGEHLPSQFESTYLQNLHAHACRGILLSWAQPHQPGTGHVNLRNMSYVRSRIEEMGYTFHAELTEALQNNSRYLPGWTGLASGLYRHRVVHTNVQAFERLDKLACAS